MPLGPDIHWPKDAVSASLPKELGRRRLFRDVSSRHVYTIRVHRTASIVIRKNCPFFCYSYPSRAIATRSVSDRAKRSIPTSRWIPTWRRSKRFGERLRNVTNSWRIRDTSRRIVVDDADDVEETLETLDIGSSMRNTMDFSIHERDCNMTLYAMSRFVHACTCACILYV